MTIRMYRFFYLIPSEYGAPFALCDHHHEMKKVPSNCILEEMSDKAILPCEDCEKENEQTNKNVLVDDLLEALIEIETAYVNGATAREMAKMATEIIREAEERIK